MLHWWGLTVLLGQNNAPGRPLVTGFSLRVGTRPRPRALEEAYFGALHRWNANATASSTESDDEAADDEDDDGDIVHS